MANQRSKSESVTVMCEFVAGMRANKYLFISNFLIHLRIINPTV